MILEFFFKQRELIKKPWQLFFLAIVCSSIGIFLSIFSFKGSESIVLIIFTIIPLIPIVTNLIKSQEKTLIREDHVNLKKIYFKQLSFVFLGLVFSYLLWSIALTPQAQEIIFKNQIENIYDLSGPFAFATFEPKYEFYSCRALNVEDYKQTLDFEYCSVSDYNKNGIQEIVLSKDDVPKYVILENKKIEPFNYFIMKIILFNNLGVFLFILITAFIFGAGAIFIITWNASIIGVFIGDLIRANIYFTDYPLFAIIYETPRVVSRLMVHGIFEFSGFFSAAIAGSILGLVITEHYKKSESRKILLFDSVFLILLGLLLLGIGALIEAYV